MDPRIFFWLSLAILLLGLCGPALADPINLRTTGTCPTSEAVTTELARLPISPECVSGADPGAGQCTVSAGSSVRLQCCPYKGSAC